MKLSAAARQADEAGDEEARDAITTASAERASAKTSAIFNRLGIIAIIESDPFKYGRPFVSAFSGLTTLYGSIPARVLVGVAAATAAGHGEFIRSVQGDEDAAQAFETLSANLEKLASEIPAELGPFVE